MMTLTLLLDLDDTLIASRMEEVFLPAYFKALGAALADFVPPERMLPVLWQASQVMLQNDDPARTLQETFDEHFFPVLGIAREDLQPVIDRFYREDFQELKRWTKPLDGAAEFVAWAFEQGFRVAIATNPLFPYLAQESRLRWAGISPDEFPLAAITAYETWHFSKFRPHYFAETLLQIGWQGGPVLMVGDDPELDLRPAAALGIPGFWVGNSDTAPEDLPLIGRGRLPDLRRLLDAGVTIAEPRMETPQQLMTWLAAVPAALHGRLAALPDDIWECKPAADAWCVTEIICHLRDVEREVNLPRVERITRGVERFIKAEETDSWVRSRNYAAQNGRQALAEFTAARKQLLAALQTLPPEDWEREVLHSIFGRITLREMIGFILRHDREHLQQAWQAAGLPTG